MQYDIVIGPWERLASDAGAIRQEVFVQEQNVPAALELDEMDAVSTHIVAYDGGGRAVATARLLPDGHIGRMAVRKPARCKGIGGILLRRLMQAAQSRGDAEVMLSAQLHAEDFYRRHGFVREGAVYAEAGIAHIAMRHRF